MKILHIELNINSKEAKFKIREIDIEKETPKQYKVAKGKGVVNKNRMLEPYTIFRNDIHGQRSVVNYTCYCLVEDESEAKTILYSCAANRLMDLNIGMKSLIGSFELFFNL